MASPLELGNSLRRPDRALGWVTLLAVALGGCNSDPARGDTATATEASMTGSATATETATDNLPTTVGESGNESGGEPAEDPGRVTVHRLNRTEYNNTVRDLLGTSQRPADSFPADDFGLGFDNIADVLSVSPVLTEKYLDRKSVV